ncbi:MAG TPA: aldo/keto reductase [Candidatus Sulfopaludibacter sp.]|jgi:aryl-alcohol dehydrogenase-like predicted oxidoreductase|nr:aldo/keto reductase [Candidatus Sulfopaludibacter sp.]
MQSRTLPHTELTVSRAAFGTMPLGTQADEATARRMFDLCMDRGINFFDTANSYNGGAAETITGNILKGRRDRVVLASKVGRKMGDAPDDDGLSPAAMRKGLDQTLRRLQTDYLDLYYLHVPDWNTPIGESLATMDEFVRAGKVRYPACSNYAGWQVVQMIAVSEARGYQPPYVSQPMYNVLARGIEQEYFAMCKAYGVAAIVYNPLAGGLLTGKQHRERPIAGTRFDNNPLYLNRYWHPGYFDAVDELQAIAQRAGRSLIDLSLNWIQHHTPVDCVILGASRMDQLEQNLDAFEKGGPLPADVVHAIDQVWNNLRGITPNYNR